MRDGGFSHYSRLSVFGGSKMPPQDYLINGTRLHLSSRRMGVVRAVSRPFPHMASTERCSAFALDLGRMLAETPLRNFGSGLDPLKSLTVTLEVGAEPDGELEIGEVLPKSMIARFLARR